MAGGVTKNINFKTNVSGTEEAKQKIADITGELDNTASTIEGELNPALNRMGDGFGEAGTAGGFLKNKLIGVVGSIVGRMGMISVIAAVTAGLTSLAKDLFFTKEKTEALTVAYEDQAEALEGLIKKQTIFATQLQRTQQELEAAGFNALAVLSGQIAMQQALISSLRRQEQIELDPQKLQDVKFQIGAAVEELNNMKETAGLLASVWDKLVERLAADKFKDLHKEIKDVTKNLKELQAVIHKGVSLRGQREPGGAGRGMQEGTVFGSARGGEEEYKHFSGATQAGLKDGFDKSKDMMEGVARAWTSTLEGNFNEFWDSTFGYANSLLEQLLKATFMSIFSSLLSFIPGGSILGAIFNSGGAGGANTPVGGTTNNMIVLKIGDEEVASFVNKGNEYNRMRRLN